MSDVSEASIVIAGRRRGRPKAIEPRSSVSAWLTARQHDRLIEIANQRGVSVSAVVRAIVSVTLKRESV